MTQLRTLTYVVKMDIGDGKVKAKDFRVTLKTMEQDALKASAQVDKLAKTIGQKYGANVQVAIDETKTVSNEIRSATREATRAEKSYERLTAEYQNLASRTGKSAEQQEKINALFRLGSGATLTQKKELVRLISAYQMQRKEANRTQGSMRGLRGQAQNLGWQLQDVAVQAQMGTNGLIILGQQGSQLASGFGPMGALIGAGIAVGAAAIGVLSKTMQTAEVDTKKLDEKIVTLRSSLDDLAGSGFSSSREFESKTIEQINVELIKLKNNNIKVTKEMTKAAVAYSKFNEFNKAGATEIAAFNKEMTDGQFVIAQNTAAIEQLNEIKRLQSVAYGRSIADTIADEKANKDLVESLELEAKTIGKSQRLKDLMLATERKMSAAQILKIIQFHDTIDAYKKEEEAQKAKIKADKEAAKELIKATSEAKKELEKSLSVQAKYDPNVKLALLQRQYAEERSMAEGNAIAIANIDQHYADERTRLNGTMWEQMALQAKDSLENTDELMFESLDRFVSGTANAFATSIVHADNFGDAMSNVFKGALTSMIAYFAELGIQQALSWAFTKTGETAAQLSSATTMTANAQAASYMAGLNAFSSTAAIPIVGPFLAPAAAVAAIAATQPMAAAVSTSAFAGVFDKGGMIPSGMSGIVSEYGDELVGGTMVYNGSQGSLSVTGREETSRKTGGVSVGGITINSSGNASPDAIARSVLRVLKKKNKTLDNAIFDSTSRGKRNGGKRYA